MDSYKNIRLEESLDITVAEILPIIQKRIMKQTHYCGIRTLKNPMDFWVYQEMIFEQKTDVVIEIGNNFGGSTFALAHFLDNIDNGRIIAIDISHSKVVESVKKHPRITWIEGDAVSVFSQVKNLVGSNERVLVIDDSAHTFENTIGILHNYSSLLSPGEYFVIEDSICHHGLDVGPSPGPYEAITEFISSHQEEFEIDREKESFFITWNPKGFIRKKNQHS